MRNESMLTKNLDKLKIQPGLTNLFIHSASSSFGLLLLLTTFLSMAVQAPCSADGVVAADEDSWLPTGLFCFRSGEGTNTQIHLAKYENGKIEELFTKTIGRMVHYPICLTNGVIAVGSDGIIRKLDMTGQFVFVSKPKGFEGVCGVTGRLDENHIFMTESVWDKENNKWLYRLCVVDISGTEPTLKTKFNIIPPLSITLIIEDIIVVGQKDILRLKIPEGL